MTETLSRPTVPARPPRRPAGPRRRRPLEVGVVAALRCAVLGLLAVGLPVLLVWATDPRSGAGAADAFRALGQVWLVAHGASLSLAAGGSLSLAPLGLCALPLALLWRAGAHAGRDCHVRSVGEAATVALAVAAPYAALAGLVAALSGGAALAPTPTSAVLSALVLGLLGAGGGVLRTDRLWRAAWLRLPGWLRSALPAALAASAALLAAGALLAAASLLAHGGRAADLADATGPGPVGGVALLLVGLALLPNAVVWGGSWLAGPGFAVGAGTAVAPFEHALGPVPALPLLAALPGAPAPAWLGVLALALPVLAGVLAGRLRQRALPAGASAGRTAAAVVPVGVLAGLLWALLAWLSAGAAGGARLAVLGPSAWQVGLAVAVEVTAGAALGALLARQRAARRAPVTAAG